MSRTLVLSFPYASAMGGGERYLERLVEGLAPRGRTFDLVSSSKALLRLFISRRWEAHPFWPAIEPVSKLAIILFPVFALIAAPLFFFIILSAKRRGTDSVICLSLTDKLLATVPARLFGLRIVWLEHLMPGRSIVLNPYRPILALLSRWATVVTVSNAVASELRRLDLAGRQTLIIPPGLGPDEFGHAAPATSPTVGVASRLAHEKNVALLIEAFVHVLKSIPNAMLVIHGTGPEYETLRNLTAELGIAEHVQFMGHTQERSRIYDGLTVLAVPSAQESFGLSALEAMGRGVPVIATRTGGLPEVVEDGVSGLLVPPDNALAFSDTLVKMLMDADLLARFSETARKRAAERFHLDRTLDAWHRLLSEKSSTR